MSPPLRVLAVSGPHWPRRPAEAPVRSFTAATPFSLQNACRLAAGLAAAGQGAWGESNWRTLTGRRESVLLLEFMDEARATLAERLDALRPNLMLIGAMTLGMPGAVEVARIVREHRGDDCLIALGGKHASETLSLQDGRVEVGEASPLYLMETGRLPQVNGLPAFDLVVAGEGEGIVAALGEAVHAAAVGGRTARGAMDRLADLRSAPGKWVLGGMTADGVAFYSSHQRLDRERIPTAPGVFGVQSAFHVFGGIRTGHAYSDMGRGCKHNCFFCSERVGVNGPLDRDGDPVGRLIQHLRDISTAGGGAAGAPVAAFVEDSILLGGGDRLIAEFVRRMSEAPLPNLRFGVQISVNDIQRLAQTGTLRGLRDVGCEYVAFGMETINEAVASRMSKYSQREPWAEANRHALTALTRTGMHAGVFVLWGLGETQAERVQQLRELKHWRSTHDGQPCAIGLNWATLHPAGVPRRPHARPAWPTLMAGEAVERRPPDFLEWGTPPESPLLPLLVELFGEASIRFPYYHGVVPAEAELRELRDLYLEVLANR
jgi:radical SAM superfamily enzyme YgiQ (UPF0313 family)